MGSLQYAADPAQKFSLSEKRELLGRTKPGDFSNIVEISEEDLMNQGDWKAFRMSETDTRDVDLGDFGQVIQDFQEQERRQSSEEALKAYKEESAARGLKDDF
jgi:hypothetical protein